MYLALAYAVEGCVIIHFEHLCCGFDIPFVFNPF